MAEIRRATMADVARRAGVSPTTVSFVLNDVDAGLPEHTKKRVLEAARELNYSPNSAARRLASRRSRALGLAIYDISYVADFMTGAASIFTSVYRAAESNGHHLTLYTTRERQETGEDIETYFSVPVRSREVDGMVVWDAYVSDEKLISSFRDGLPIVMVDRQVVGVPCVVPDYQSGMRQIVDLLVDKGHERFAFLYSDTIYRDLRILEAFQQMMREVDAPPDHVALMENNRYAGRELDPTVLRIRELLQMPTPPTAIICSAARNGLIAIAELREQGVRVPEDMAVVSCSDVPAATFPTIALTALNVRLDIMGRHAVELLLRMVRGEDVSGTRVVVQPELEIRGTV